MLRRQSVAIHVCRVQKATTNDDRLLTTEQAGARFGIEPTLLARIRREGNGPPFVRLGGRTIKYRAQDVRAWIDNLASDAPSADRLP